MAAKRKIKVLHIMPHIQIGGAEMQLCYLISNSDPKQVQHEVLYYSDPNDKKGYELYDKKNISYHRVARNKKKPIKFLRDFSKEIKKRNPDIVHCWLWSGNIWGRWAALLAGVEHIIVAYRNCSMAHPFIVKNLERFTKNRVHYLANSRAGANYVARKLGVAAEKFEVICNGIDVSKFEASCKRSDVFAGLDIPDNVKIVTMVGTLIEQKNYPMLLKIAEKCKHRNLPVRFMIAGHGNKEEELKSLAESLGLNGFVHFLGLRRDVVQILACSDIFCYTSLWEGFPNALMEAMAAKLPIITTKFEGVSELIEDQKSAFLVGFQEINTTCDIIKKLIENKNLKISMGNDAFKRLTEHFTIEQMVERTNSFYHKLLT